MIPLTKEQALVLDSVFKQITETADRGISASWMIEGEPSSMRHIYANVSRVKLNDDELEIIRGIWEEMNNDL